MKLFLIVVGITIVVSFFDLFNLGDDILLFSIPLYILVVALKHSISDVKEQFDNVNVFQIIVSFIVISFLTVLSFSFIPFSFIFAIIPIVLYRIFLKESMPYLSVILKNVILIGVKIIVFYIILLLLLFGYCMAFGY